MEIELNDLEKEDIIGFYRIEHSNDLFFYKENQLKF
jgi:hypothetical protein